MKFSGTFCGDDERNESGDREVATCLDNIPSNKKLYYIDQNVECLNFYSHIE